MEKRGQGLSTSAIVLIVLAVIVLVILVLGFTMGWDKFAPWISGKENVQTIVTACQLACSSESTYDYCSKSRTLNDGENKITTNCATFSVINEYAQYGIDECPAIECDFNCEDIKSAGEVMEVESCPEDYDDVTSIANVPGGQKCCVPKS